jgi:hypothetical protein
MDDLPQKQGLPENHPQPLTSGSAAELATLPEGKNKLLVEGHASQMYLPFFA